MVTVISDCWLCGGHGRVRGLACPECIRVGLAAQGATAPPPAYQPVPEPPGLLEAVHAVCGRGVPPAGGLPEHCPGCGHERGGAVVCAGCGHDFLACFAPPPARSGCAAGPDDAGSGLDGGAPRVDGGALGVDAMPPADLEAAMAASIRASVAAMVALAYARVVLSCAESGQVPPPPPPEFRAAVRRFLTEKVERVHAPPPGGDPLAYGIDLRYPEWMSAADVPVLAAAGLLGLGQFLDGFEILPPTPPPPWRGAIVAVDIDLRQPATAAPPAPGVACVHDACPVCDTACGATPVCAVCGHAFLPGDRLRSRHRAGARP